MAIGSISSLGVGSGFELLDLLDQLREVGEAPINFLKAEKTEVEERLAEFNTVNGKLLAMKSHALALSLASNFLGKNISVSDEDVVTATVLTGTSETTNSVKVNLVIFLKYLQKASLVRLLSSAISDISILRL